MKKLLLSMLFWNAYLISSSQVEESGEEDIIFSLGQRSIAAYFGEDKYSENSSDYYSILDVRCITYCSELKWPYPKSGSIFRGSTYAWGPVYGDIFHESTFKRSVSYNLTDEEYKKKFNGPINEKTVDSLFQNLYDWLKEIEDFAINHVKHRVSYKMNYHNVYNWKDDYYYLEAHRSYIKISTSIYKRDEGGYTCDRWTIMNLNDITELKKLFLDFTKEHNISIRL